MGGWRKKRRQASIGLLIVCVDRGYRESGKEAEKEVESAGGLIRNVERICPLCRVWSAVFLINIIDPPLRGPMRVAKNDQNDKAGMHGYMRFNNTTNPHTHRALGMEGNKWGREQRRGQGQE